MGFQSRTNYTHYHGSLGYGWLPGEPSVIQNHQLGVRTSAYTDNLSNDMQSFDIMVDYNIKLKSDFSGNFLVGHLFENVTETFGLSPNVLIPVEKYEFNQIEAHINSPGSKRLMIGLNMVAGTFYDGNRFSPGLESEFKIGSSLQFSASYDHDFLNFKNRKQDFSGGIFGFKAQIMFSTSLSASTFVQYNSEAEEVISNFRFRYNPKEGNDFFIVFNEGRNIDRENETLHLSAFNKQTVLLKYTYTFNL